MKLVIALCIIGICGAITLDEALDHDIEQWKQKPDTYRGFIPKLSMAERFRASTGSEGYVILKDVSLSEINR